MTAYFDLHTATGTPASCVELTDALADQVRLLHAVFGRLAFLAPDLCASCGRHHPEGARDTFGIAVMNNEPIVFFLCSPCLEATRAGSDDVGERVYERIDALVGKPRTAQA